MSTRYKDYNLDTSTSAGSDDWMTSIHVSKLSSDGYQTKAFYCKDAFRIEEEAQMIFVWGYNSMANLR